MTPLGHYWSWTTDSGAGTPMLTDHRWWWWDTIARGLQTWRWDTIAHGLQTVLWGHWCSWTTDAALKCSALFSSLLHFQMILTYCLLSGITSFVCLSAICLLHCLERIPSTCNPICCVWKEWLKVMSNRPVGSVVKLPVTLSRFSPEFDLLLPLTTSFQSYIRGVSLVTKKQKSKVVFSQKAI